MSQVWKPLRAVASDRQAPASCGAVLDLTASPVGFIVTAWVGPRTPADNPPASPPRDPNQCPYGEPHYPHIWNAAGTDMYCSGLADNPRGDGTKP